jgi:1,4-alpha-glucan branching enzyme
MHALGIQVILDWVPAHFPKDAHGLGRFDGMPLYEHPDPRKGEHPDWGTYIFNYGKNEVANFLLANALFWLDKYHVDGLRVDAVASMLYLDYGRQEGQWLPNKDGGNEHYEAVEFLRHLNQVVRERFPEDYIIAEESTAWPKVTEPVESDGLGFTYKWNMGWMNDFTEYMKLDPYFKSHHHDQLCFSLSYYLSENYILVLSHDEVVHGKCSMLNKMPGLMGDKYANLKAAYGFFYGHPGKKLLFMGQEFAQLREWSEARELDWDLLQEKPHVGIQKFIKDMNFLYQSNDALYYNDHDVMGFEWMDCQSWERSTIAFVRRGKSRKHQLLFILNFTPIGYDDYAVKVPCKGKFTEIVNSDNEIYGGQGRLNKNPITAFHAGDQWKIICKLPPCSVVVLQYDYQS